MMQVIKKRNQDELLRLNLTREKVGVPTYFSQSCAQASGGGRCQAGG